MSADAVFLDDSHFRIGETRFHCSLQTGREVLPADDILSVMKTRVQIERYLRLCAELKPRIIAEIGIRRGGGTALLHALNEPELLIGIELKPEPAPALATYIETRGLASIVKPFYGVNQADRDCVASILAKELNGRQLDLVVDDASHLLAETRVTFETLFPLLRPGGIYVVEDWNADHLIADTIERMVTDVDSPRHDERVHTLNNALATKPTVEGRLVRFPLELVLARASRRDLIRDITVMDNWILIQRGEEAIDPDSFRVADLAKDYFKNLRPLA